ncbi:hypothetical protein JTB14_021457 [Gonioctena quinquepunctata]|nr:hypothetical protein JTB14_021457 [Gonioctena quinquepunctata]
MKKVDKTKHFISILQGSHFENIEVETHFKPNENFQFRGFKSYRKDAIPDRRARGGVAIFIRKNLPHRAIPLQSPAEVVAIEMSYPFKMSLGDIYLPNSNWTVEDLRNIMNQLLQPFLIMALDLAFCSPNIAPLLRWICLGDHLTDHFPIKLECASQNTSRLLPRRWKIEKANWPLYKTKVDTIELLPDDVNEATELFTQKIIGAAQDAVPKTGGIRRKKSLPWWNNEIALSISRKNGALNVFKRNPSLENMIAFKKARAKSRRLIRESKKRTWEEYVSTITLDTPAAEVWNKIRSILEKEFTEASPILEVNGQVIVNNGDIAEALTAYFESLSGSQNYEPEFLQHKATVEIDIDFGDDNLANYNVPFTITELENALTEVKNTAPGEDEIVYEFLKQLTPSAKQILLHLYNNIWSTARPSKLKVLDSIQGTALRLALGAFRTSPYESLCVEAGVPPVKFRREQLLVSYCCGILAQPHHPCYPPIPSDEEYDIYARRATITRPAGTRPRELLNSLDYDIPRIHNWTPCETPPWTLNISKMELQLTEFQKKRNEPKPYYERISQDEKRVSRLSHNIYRRIRNRGRGGSCFYMLGK